MGNVTAKAVEKLKKNPPAAGNMILWDGELRGFGARVTAAGVVSFVLEYRAMTKAKDADGKDTLVEGAKRRYTIGQYPEWSVERARDEAIELRKRIREGRDPLEAKAALRNAPTMEELCRAYTFSVRFGKKRESSKRDDRAMIDKIILPRLGQKRVLEVTRKHVEDLHGSMETTPYRANRVLALLSTIFSFAIAEGLVAENPTKGIERFHEEKREAWLTVDQMRALDEALNNYAARNADGANALRMLILTGARAGEVLQANWSEFDLERGIWTKPSHHTKQKKTQGFPLNAAALELLKGMKPKGATGPLFAGTQRKLKGKRGQVTGGDARVSLKRPWTSVCAAAGLAEEYFINGKRKDKQTGQPVKLRRWRPTVRVHDLRHSYASFLVSNGAPLQVVGRLLGHTQASTTQRYAHAHDDALRSATEMMSNVLPFRKVG